MLTRDADTSLTEQLAQRYAQRIRDRLMPAGMRLPSVRDCAQRHGVSPSTVVAAYDLLLAQGLVEARRRRGFFVRGPRARPEDGPPQPRLPAPPGPALIDAAALMRGMFQPGPGGRPMPGSGVLPPEWLDAPFLGAALRRIASAPVLASLTHRYGEPAGDAHLRRTLAGQLADLDIVAEAGQIVTTVGATQALDIVARALLRPGDAVLVEEPGWAVELARLSHQGMQLLPVPRGVQGPDLDVIEQYCRQGHTPRLFVCVSVLHNPTGGTIAPAHAHRLLQLAQRHGFTIAEDDTYRHLEDTPATRLAALDQLAHTIYVSGFSKVLAPNWRIGYLAAAPALIDRLVEAKLLSTLTTPALLEQAIALCLEQGAIRRHARRLRERLDAARARSTRLALQHGMRLATPPHGLFGWVDTGVDSDRLAQALLDEGYMTAPGALFMTGRRPSTCMRINFATTQEPAFWRVLAGAVARVQHPRRR